MPRLPDVDLNLYLPRPPFWMVATALVLVVASWLPLALFARAFVSKMDRPRVHLWQDMDNQAKLKAQSTSPLFADGSAMRGVVPGTVARGELRLDDHLERGFETDAELRPVLETVGEGETAQTFPKYFASLPASIEVDEAFVRRGQVVYATYCFPCHGHDGRGAGPVHVRATSIGSEGWVVPSNLVDPALNPDGSVSGYPYAFDVYADGKLYGVIAHGIRNMAGYGHAIEPEDRWAVVAYVRALQLSQRAPRDLIPAEALDDLQAK